VLESTRELDWVNERESYRVTQCVDKLVMEQGGQEAMTLKELLLANTKLIVLNQGWNGGA